MEAQSYHQRPSPAESDPHPPAPRPDAIAVPGALRWAVAGLVVYIALLAALPIEMMADRGALAETIARENPSLDPEHLGFATAASLAYSIVLHVLVGALSIWLVAKVLRGRRWARVTLTAYLVIASFASLVSAAAGTEFLWAVIPSDVIHLAGIALLWLPKPVRRFFAAHRLADRSRSRPTA